MLRFLNVFSIIREEWYLYWANWNTTPNLIINGDLINNWTLWWSLTTWRQFNTYVKWTILNNGTISNIYNFYIYWDFENNWIFSTSSTKLAWDSFGWYNDYYINLSYNTWSVEVNNSTSYNIPLTKLTSWESITWNVLWNWLIYDNPDWKWDRCINVPWCVNISTEQLIIPIPAYLKQYIKSPLLDEEEILVWSKIGKFQSWSWVILEAVIENNTENEYNLVFDVYRLWFVNPQYTEKVQIKSWTWRIIVPFLWAWDYSWNVRVETLDWSNSSEIVELMWNYSFETDYSIFEWFEPYPYGYNFYNRWVENLVLTWWINYSFNPVDLLISRQKKDWNKWEIFNSAFELSGYTDEQLLDAFEYLWLNKDTAFQNWNCYGMAVSATMQYKHPEFLENYFSWFSTKIGTWSIWSNIESPSTTSTWEWDIYNDTLKTILTEHLSQYSFNDRISLFNWYSSWTTILSELTNNPDNTYIIAFLWKDKDGNVIWHWLVPYRVEWNKIYVWDNNIEYPYYESYDKIINKNEKIFSYSQYITINNDWTYDIPYYTKIFNSFDEISLINIDDIYNNWNRSWLIWFLSFDILYTLDWKSDLLVTDSEWRISWFSWWTILDEIPWVQVIIPLTNTFTLSTENTWKQIYLPQKIDNLTIKVNWKTEENYDLMIAWWDYYTKLEWISTSSWQIDTFNISRENIKIDLDDNKTSTWTYNLLIDNFQDTWTWTVYVDSVKLNTNPQQYNVNWSEVINNTNTAVNYQIDTNNDWIYNESISVPVITSWESLIWTETPIEKYIFPSQTISYDSWQQTAISWYQTIVWNYEWFTWWEDISFTTWWQWNPTVQTSNGNRASSGTFRWWLNILMDVPPRWESYTWYVDIAWVRLEFTVTRDPLPPLDVWILDFWIKTVNYGWSVYSNRVSFPFVPEETEFRLIWEWNPTVLTSNGTRSNTWSVRYGTNIEVEIPAIWQTRVIEFSILWQTWRFTVTRE